MINIPRQQIPGVLVMPALVAGIHVFLSLIAEVRNKTWMAGT